MQFRIVLDKISRVLLAIVALLLLSMPRVSAYDKWHLSAADIEEGKPYWISFVSADHKNLSTEPTSVTKPNYSYDYSTTRLSIQQIDFTDLLQQVYFESSPTAGEYYMYTKAADGTKTYMRKNPSNNWDTEIKKGEAENKNDFKFQVLNVAGTDYVRLKVMSKDWLVANRGIMDGGPVFCDNTNRYMALWQIMPADPLGYLKVELDRVSDLLANAKVGTDHNTVKAQSYIDALQTAYNSSSATYESLKNTSELTTAQLSSLQTAWETVYAARNTFLHTAYNPIDVTKQYVVKNQHGEILTRNTTNNGQAQVIERPTTIGDNQLMTFSVDGNGNYTLRSNAATNSYLQTSTNKWANNQVGQLAEVNARWSKDNNRRQFYLHHFTNDYVGIYFNTPGLKANFTNESYLDYGIMEQTNGMYNLRAEHPDGIDNPTAYWQLEEFGGNFVMHIKNLNNEEALRFTYSVMKSEYGQPVSLPVRMRNDAMVESYTYYKDAACTQPVSKWQDVVNANATEIWVKYTLKANPGLKFDSSYDYSLRIDSNTPRYLKGDSSGNITTDATTLNVPADCTDAYRWKLTATGNDPYDVTITPKLATSNMLSIASSAVGTSANDISVATTTSIDGNVTKWIIVNGNDGYYRLLAAGPDDNYRYVIYNNNGTLNVSSSDKADTFTDGVNNNAVQMKVTPLIPVTYKIIRNDGSEFCSVAGNAPGMPDLPSTLKSPLAQDYRYYTSLADAKAGTNPVTDWATADAIYYVRYSYNPDNGALADGKSLSLDGSAAYQFSGIANAATNKNFNYINPNNNWTTNQARYGYATVLVVVQTGPQNTDYFKWVLEGSDPYGITIRNLGMMNHNFDKGSLRLGAPVTSDNDVAPALYNDNDMAKMSPYWAYIGDGALVSPVFGDNSKFRYFNHQNNSHSTREATFSSGSLPENANVTFLWTGALNSYRYHIIDLSGKEAISAQTSAEVLTVPPAIYSPLVDTYTYYTLGDFDVNGDKYTLKPSATSLTALPENTHDIYVTYTVGSAIDLTNQYYANQAPYDGTTYSMQYTNAPDKIHQEVEDSPNYGYYYPVYPYVCGTGGFFLYGSEKYETTIKDGKSTGSRYEVNFEGGDPYNLRIVFAKNFDKGSYHHIYQSNDSIDDPNIKWYSYFCTYEDSNEGIVTTLTQLDRSTLKYTDSTPEENKPAYEPSRYMLVGASTSAVSLYTRDTFNGEHHLVRNYQHMWKSKYDYTKAPSVQKQVEDKYGNGFRLHTLDIDRDWFRKTNPKIFVGSKNEEYYVKNHNLQVIQKKTDNTTDSTATLKVLTTTTRENLDNDSLYHYFQTVDMGPVFSITKAEAPPVIYLLDNHRWRIVALRLYESARATLRRFNSPLVKRYKWYKLTTAQRDAAKIDSYYKYDRFIDDAQTTDGHTYLGETTDLSDWQFVNFDENDAKDMTYFVTYEVQDIYKTGVGYDAETDMLIPSVIFEENLKLATPGTSDDEIKFTTNASSYYDPTEAAVTEANMLKANPTEEMLWKIRRNVNIDTECGALYEGQNTDSKLILTVDNKTTKAEIEAYYDAHQQNGFDPYNVQVISTKRLKDNNTNRFITASYNSDSTIVDNGVLTLTAGDSVRCKRKTATTDIVEKISGTTFMYVMGADGYAEMVCRFTQTHAMRNDGGVLKVYKKTGDNKDARARFTPVANYKLYIKQEGAATYDVGDAGDGGLDVWAVAGHPIEMKKYKRDFCSYTYYATRESNVDEKLTTFSNPITLNLARGGNIFTIYTFDSSTAGIRFFPTVEDLLNDSNQGTAWQFLQMGVGLQPETTFSYGSNLGMYFGSSTGGNDNASASERDMLKPGEKTFLVTDGSRSLHFLQRSGGMQAPVSAPTTGEVTQLPTTDDENVNAQVGKHYIASLGRSVNVDLLSPRNDFRRIAETFKDGNDANYREGRWLWGFVGTPYSFQIVNKETAATKRLTVKRTWTEDGETKTYTGYTGNPQLTTHFGDAADKADYGCLWSLGNGYTDEADQNTFQLKLVDADNCVAMQGYNNPTLGLFRSDVTSDIDRKHRSLKAYPWNWSDNKYKPVKVKVYQDAVADGNLVKTFTYGAADRAFMAGDVIDGTNDHYLLRHTMEDGTPVTAESTDEYGVTIPYDDHKLNLPYDILRKFCDYFVDQDGDGTADSYTVTASDEEQTINLVFTVQTGDLIPKFIKESDLATFKTLSNSQTFKDGNKKEDYYYFLDIWPDIRSHMYIYQKEYENIDGLGTKAKRWAFNYNVSRFRIGDVNAMKWYFVGNPYAVRLYNALADVSDMNLGINMQSDDDHQKFVFSTERKFDDVAIMHSDNDENLVNGGKFYWEMVDGPRRSNGSYYEDTNDLVTYRLDKIKDNGFSLRVLNGDGKSDVGGATYRYLSLNYSKNNDGQFNKYEQNGTNTVIEKPLYDREGDDLHPRGNLLKDTQMYFPATRHASATDGNLCTVFPVARVYLTVYDHEDTGTKVTDYELSEHYGVTDRFSGVPENLKRQFCDYTWLSTDEKPNGSNNLINDDYMELDDSEMHLYATYQETKDSPFSMLDEEGNPVLKRADSFGQSPWYNLKVGNRWALFESNLQGLNGSSKLNNSEIAFNFGNNLSDEGDKIFKKGMHWALIGDPYNFTLKSRRDRIRATTDGTTINYDLSSDGNYQYDEAYIGKHEVTYNDNSKGIEPYLTDKSSAIYWTLLHNATAHERPELSPDYFLSESETRRSSTQETPAPRNGMRKMPANYIIKSQPQTLNFYQNNGTKRVNSGNYYAVGSTVTLTAIDNAGAQNDSFDAIVNVYNKLNELVATTGWTELARNNATWSSELPIDVKRWGCTYHFWGDETMTKYPFQNYQQKIDSSGNLVSQTIDQETGAITNNGEGEYLIPDGGTVYVNYDYDESLYSSENEYRWVNMLFNWDSQRNVWLKQKREKPWYTTEDWVWEKEGETGKYVLRAATPLTQTVEIYDGSTPKYKKTKEGWISSPATSSEGSFSKDFAYADQRIQTKEKDQKWALIGDPYRFILYNYQRRHDARTSEPQTNAYYLVYQNGNIKNVDLSNISIEDKANHQGLYWTWKTDGTNYQYQRPTDNPSDQDLNADNETIYASETYVRTGLPESYYKDKTDRTKLESGYLAVCDMKATSLYQTAGTLVGAIQTYATFKPETVTTTETNQTATYKTGCNNKYLGYWPKGYKENTDPLYYYQGDNYTVNTENNQQDYSAWRTTYGYTQNSSGQTYWNGPKPEPETEVVTRQYKETVTEEPAISQTLQTTGEQTTDASVLKTGGAKRFLVVPMAEKAASVTFHLDPTSHAASKRNWTTHPVWDYTTRNYGVDNTIALPWMMRRQYCYYTYYLVEESDQAPTSTSKTGVIDSLTHREDSPSSEHSIATREDTYTSFWHDGDTNMTPLTVTSDGEVVIPSDWDGKHVYIRVTYQPTADFIASTSNDGLIGENKTVRWLNIVNQEKGNMLQYTRTHGTMGDNKNAAAELTNDYLWAVEGDPYGFVLHNRYADHGFNGTTANENWSTKVLQPAKINSNENYNYTTENNENFAGGLRSGLNFAKVADENTARGIMGAASDNNSIFEAMTGNYDGAMLLHPVAAPVNVRNQNGYKYYSGFLFNATNQWPVQLNYLEDWEVMRNVFANWRLQKPTKEQILPYYNRAGFVGGLKPDVASTNKALFSKVSDGSASNTEYNTAWALVHNPDNLVAFTDGGYYRLKAYSSDNANVGGKYVSGYLHKLELDAEGGTPLHLYEKAGSATTLDKLDSYIGNEWAAGFESKIDVMNPEYDPSSIFRFSRNDDGHVKMETQGLVVSDNAMVEAPANADDETDAMYFEMQDIGLTTFQMRTEANITGKNAETSYLSYNPATMKYALNVAGNELSISEGHINDDVTVKTHDTKWLLEPVGTTATNTAGTVYQHALKVKMLDMGYGDFYATACFPFDVKLPNGAYAFGFQNKDGSIRSEKKEDGTFQINIAQIAGNDTDSPKDVENNPNMVVPAGVPVLLYIYENSLGDLTSASELPLMMASEGDCKLDSKQIESLQTSEMKYQYLTQELKDVAPAKTIFVFSKASGKTGFMRNANKDYTGATNNRFVAHNKIYYVGDYGNNASSAKVITLNYTTLFDPDDYKETDGINEIESDDASSVESRKNNDVIYDLHGRRIEHVNRTGIYIVNGRKVLIKK